MSEADDKTITELREGPRRFSARARRDPPSRGGIFNTAVRAREGFQGGRLPRPRSPRLNAAVAAAERLTTKRPSWRWRAADSAARSSRSAGIPLGIKDLFATEGVDSTAGSNILKGFKPTYESTVSGNLKAAGAGMLGKLNMDEFAMGSSNETSAYGPVIAPGSATTAAMPR